MKLDWGERPVFTVKAPQGDASVVPEKRNFELEFIGIEKCDSIEVTENDIKKPAVFDYEENVLKISVEDVCGELVISFKEPVKEAKNPLIARLCSVIENLEHIPNTVKDSLEILINNYTSEMDLLSRIIQLNLDENVLLALSEIITAEI